MCFHHVASQASPNTKDRKTTPNRGFVESGNWLGALDQGPLWWVRNGTSVAGWWQLTVRGAPSRWCGHPLFHSSVGVWLWQLTLQTEWPGAEWEDLGWRKSGRRKGEHSWEGWHAFSFKKTARCYSPGWSGAMLVTTENVPNWELGAGQTLASSFWRLQVDKRLPSVFYDVSIMGLYRMPGLEDGHQGKKYPTNSACQSNVPPNSDDHPDPGVIIGEEEGMEGIYPAGIRKQLDQQMLCNRWGWVGQRGFLFFF